MFRYMITIIVQLHVKVLINISLLAILITYDNNVRIVDTIILLISKNLS